MAAVHGPAGPSMAAALAIVSGGTDCGGTIGSVTDHVFVGDLAQVLMMELVSLLLYQCYFKFSS